MPQHQSCLMTRPFSAQRPLPIWAALSDRMEVPMRTFRADWAKPGTPVGVRMQSGGHHSTASRQAEALPELRVVDPCVWIRVLVDDRAWPCQAVDLSHDKPQENPTHLLAKNHPQLWPLSTVPARGYYGDHHDQEAMALDWARAAQGCQLHHQSCNPLDPRGKAEAWLTEDNLAKKCGSGNEER